MTDDRKSDSWLTIDFKPAPPGWRLVYLKEGEKGLPAELYLRAFPGWLVQEKIWHTFHREAPMLRRADPPSHESPQRRVVAGHCGIGSTEADLIVPADYCGQGAFWKLLAPGEDPPSHAEIERRLGDLVQHRKYQDMLAEHRKAQQRESGTAN